MQWPSDVTSYVTSHLQIIYPQRMVSRYSQSTVGLFDDQANSSFTTFEGINKSM